MTSEIKKCKCGREFALSEKEKEFYKEKGLHEPVRCPVCREKRKQADQTFVCIDCGKEVSISASNLMWYDEKGYQRPKRCKECAERNRHILDEVKKIRSGQ